MVTFDCPRDRRGKGYLAQAEGAKSGVVVMQEWWGLNDQIRRVTDRFAARGFAALAPDLYDGRVTREPDEANHMMEGLDWVGATRVEVRGALQYLRGSFEKVAVVGFCLGGALTIIAAAELSECAAAVCFYGIPPVDQADPARIKVPLQGHFAERDDWCLPTAVNALERTLDAAGARFDFHRYEAHHAFFNEDIAEYHAEAAALAWRRTIEFLNVNLA